MADPEAKRKLTAILSADVAGYSRLMGDDERATLETLTAYRRVMTEAIARHEGRVVDHPGDALLAEFASPVEAVACAVAIQRELSRRNSQLAEHRQMHVRIGLNLGDVLEQDGALYGDGVNIAARLEALADPGGLCLSGPVYDQVAHRVPLTYEDLGEQTVKNIRQPVRAYRVVMDAEAVSQAQSATPPKRASHRTSFIAAAVMLVLAITGAVAWYTFWRPTPLLDTAQESQAETDTPFPSQQEAPSLDPHPIAVLPFVNMSADAENEYFSDGMTEELISKLSRIRELAVIARTSVMKFKETDKDIAEIGQALQVGTILEGSVRKAGNKLRIAVQLIDVPSQEHLWSQDYDRELQDVFVIQSEVAQQVADALHVELLAGEQHQLAMQGTENVAAYNAYLKGQYFWNKVTGKDLQTAITYFEQAIAHDPTYALAYVGLANTYNVIDEMSNIPSQEARAQAKAFATQALALDDTLAEAHTALALISWNYEWDWEGAARGYQRALELNPGYARTYHFYCWYFLSQRRFEEALAMITRGQELDPLSLIINIVVGSVFLIAGQYDEALAQFEKALAMDPNFMYAHWTIGMTYTLKGMYDEGIAALQKALALSGGYAGQRAFLGWAYVVAGRRDDALKTLDTLHAEAQHEPVDPIFFAQIYGSLGENDQAFAWLHKAYEQRSNWLMFLKVHAPYDNLRSDPGFTELLQKIGLPTD